MKPLLEFARSLAIQISIWITFTAYAWAGMKDAMPDANGCYMMGCPSLVDRYRYEILCAAIAVIIAIGCCKIYTTRRPNAAKSKKKLILAILLACVIGLLTPAMCKEIVLFKDYILATAGNADAQFKIGKSYMDSSYKRSGAGGYNKDDNQKTINWWRAAAEQGHAKAANGLADMYAYGTNGITVDDAEEIKWRRIAAESGNRRSQVILANCYYYGKKLTLDYEEAYFWYSLAGEKDRAKASSKHLTPRQKASIEKRLEDWKDKGSIE